MTQQPYQGRSDLDRSEMFAIGAAAGAVITAAISEYLERRNRPKTRLEQVQDVMHRAGKATSERTQTYADVAGQYARGTSTKVRNQARQARKEAVDLKDATVAALGVGAASGLADKARDYVGSAVERIETVASNSGARDTIRDAATTAGASLKEYVSSAREAVQEAELGEKARTLGAATAGTVAAYTATAREKLKDVELGDRARDYSSLLADTVKEYSASARETLKDAKLADKAKDYASLVSESAHEYTDKLRDAKLGEKAKDYVALAGTAAAAYGATATQAARQSADKLSDSAVHLVSATGEQAADVRKNVRKGVKRTQRRTRWGLRSFVIGLVVGILSAPESGRRTREAITSFVEQILDILMPDDPQGGSSNA